MPIKYNTPKFFADFSCLGGDCQDTCCRDWEVKLDRQHYDLLQACLHDDAATAELFKQYIELNDSPVSGDHDYAFIRMQENGYCAMLDEQGLCRIHAKYGVEPLGNVCMMFPRVISRCGDVVEMSGAMSCPEVVRLCLSADDVTKLTRFKPADLPRSSGYPITRELSQSTDDFYAQNFVRVREIMMQLIANEQFDLETRLYALANLAYKLSGFYHRYCSAPDEQLLTSVLAGGSDTVALQKMQSYIRDYFVDNPIAMIVINSVLQIKQHQSPADPLGKIYLAIYDFVGEEALNNMHLLRERFRDADNELAKYVDGLLDRAISHYLISSLYREWFVTMPDPFTYTQMLLVRLAILRFLLVMYLTVKRQDTELNPAEIETVVIDVIYRFARSIDQNLEFLKVVYNALAEQEMMTFDYSPAFIRL